MSWDDNYDDYMDGLGVDRYEGHDTTLLGWTGPSSGSFYFDGEVIHRSDERWEELKRRFDEADRLKEEARREEREKKEREWDEQHWRKHTVGMTDEEKAEFERSLQWHLRWSERNMDLDGEPF